MRRKELHLGLANTVAMVRGRIWSRSTGIVTAWLWGLGHFTPSCWPVMPRELTPLNSPPNSSCGWRNRRLISDWSYQPALKVSFKLGSKQHLKELKEDITKALREAVKPEIVAEDEGPEELRRLLQFGNAPPPPAPAATLRSIRPQLVDGAWHIQAEVSFNDKRKRLRITPRACD